MLIVLAPAGFVISLIGYVKGDDAEVGGVESGVDLIGIDDAADEEAGADEGDQREGQLAHYEQSAGPPSTAAGRGLGARANLSAKDAYEAQETLKALLEPFVLRYNGHP